ncbi:hypothetical protein ABBQ32_013232 [Trebouxia sp. C0010 RCD-2024]
MTEVFHHGVALLPTKQRFSQRLPPRERKAGYLLQAVPHKTGRAQACCNVCCCSSQGQLPNICHHSHQGQPAHVRQEGPDISNLDPVLQQQWDHAANAQLGDIVIKPYSNKVVWWTCDQCPDGHPHSWSAHISQRTIGTGCPQCTGRKVCKHNSLATKAPLVAAQWDYQANDRTPDDVVAQSNLQANWHCEACGCKWDAEISIRVGRGKTGCPQCAKNAKTQKRTKHPTLAECNHPLLEEWDKERNAAQGHFPDNVRLRSNKKIFWLCAKCPAGQQHSWSAQPFSQTGSVRAGCPFCAGQAACACNSLQALCPDTAAEWDYNRSQGQPCEYTASSTFLAWWLTPQRGSWQQTIASRTANAKHKSSSPQGATQRLNAARSS